MSLSIALFLVNFYHCFCVALRKLRGYFDVEDEIDEMKVEARKSQSVESFTLKQLLTTVDLRWPVIIACVLQISQQWSGINAVSQSYSSRNGHCLQHAENYDYSVLELT